ncbi:MULTISPECIES: aromatic-ring-hydroxylating dioxygenase subunit beta [Mycolicibacterium]|jgi:biphenyl 2,3-dioxygenase beta subunit|uniref:Benzene 1,2-dioxygenase n=1 Tax=Mycolicibacterium vanbaalenii (strain DSM 7251 / JCM 13017 / BCRC 16820 / KCTC 9966 / NRRL B-24157 / PYR-1) TaxID=350058 RepID=A1TDE2_MYCVP|nr:MULTISPECIES: aromatic-ring-hydroxylating dioxygenase subunit beta [Mycolicibacterium]ABM15192.1 Benzene 1,2-dioxygenase [Mycolicibacterium vanbaalenii PYR-1]MCV7127072.1 aromatic-ring-hydroxylating dioxygenase subunit beta [Mycolicibacterium vanbaalenii PYR-1]QZT55558.1 aromatic-ring-hydroxylating dioxygenase subunit beta [Mycolicibacterium austroafricanum]QZT61509.1 aromatic-ring-hydroxylating dioxygenase subunit beta [Mycolicibacterium austroafricanum]
MNADVTSCPSTYRTVDPQIQHSVEQFLYAEAELLDQHRYLEWVELFAEDTHYWVPTRMTRPNRERHLEVAGEDEAALIDDDKFFLRGRARRYSSGISWSEEPPSRTRRLITNIRISRRTESNDLEVCSNFYVYRSRLERHQDWFVGERFDVLRAADINTTGYPYVIAARKVVLEQTTLLCPSLSIFL